MQLNQLVPLNMSNLSNFKYEGAAKIISYWRLEQISKIQDILYIKTIQ